MALTSSSTYSETITEFKATDGYRITESASEARRFARACRRLRGIEQPANATKGSNSVSFSPSELQEMENSAETYADLVDGGRTASKNIVHYDGRNMRTNG